MDSETIPLSWPAADAARRYRVAVRDVDAGTFVHKGICENPAYELPIAALDTARRYQWKVQVDRTGVWEEWQRYQELSIRADGASDGGPVRGSRLSWPAVEGVRGYRVIVRDEGGILLKQIVYEPFLDLDWSRLPSGRRLQYRVQRQALDGSWEDHTPYEPLMRPYTIPMPRPSQRPEASHEPGVAAGDLLFLYTVDVEANIYYMRHPDYGGAVDAHVFGRCGEGEYGIGFMMDILDDAGFKGTFFVDVLMHYQYGREGLERTVGAVLDRGHDVQLHLHPKPHFFYAEQPDLRSMVYCMNDQASDAFARTLDTAIRCFEKTVGRPPIAYRAGSYRLQPAALPLLSRFGIRIDSSVYPLKNCEMPGWMQTRTQPYWIEGVLEVPVSWMLEKRIDGQRGYQYNLNARLAPAVEASLAAIPSVCAGVQTLVVMAHSYTLLREIRTVDERDRERWNTAFAAVTPPDIYALRCQPPPKPLMFCEGVSQERVSMLQSVVRRAAAEPGVRGISFRELHDRWIDRLGHNAGPVDPLPVWHAKERCITMTGTRRYSASYLEHLENEAVRPSSREGQTRA